MGPSLLDFLLLILSKVEARGEAPRKRQLWAMTGVEGHGVPTICSVALVCGVVLVCLLPFAASTDCFSFVYFALCNCISSILPPPRPLASRSRRPWDLFNTPSPNRSFRQPSSNFRQIKVSSQRNFSTVSNQPMLSRRWNLAGGWMQALAIIHRKAQIFLPSL